VLRAAIGIALASVLYVSVYLVASAQLGRLLPNALAETIGGRDADKYTVEIGTVRLSPLLDGLTVSDLAVSFDTTTTDPTAEPALIRDARIDAIRVSKISLIPLLRGKAIIVSSVDIVGPTLALEFVAGQGQRPPLSEEGSADASDLESGARSPPTAALGRLRIRDGNVDLSRVTDRGTLLSSIRGLDIELTEAVIDSITFANPVRALTNSRVSIAFDTVLHTLDDSLYAVAAIQLRADSRDSVVEIGTVRITPTLRAARFFERLPEREDRINLSAGPVRIEGLDFRRYVRDESVRVRSIDVDSLDLHVYADINLDWGRVPNRASTTRGSGRSSSRCASTPFRSTKRASATRSRPKARSARES
jgi:hypothetical protein